MPLPTRDICALFGDTVREMADRCGIPKVPDAA